MMVVKGEQWAPNTHSGVWTCDEVSLKKSSLGRRICHTHKIPRTLVLLVPEVSIQVLGFARPCPIKLSHLMKEVHGVCISSLLQSCSLPHGPHPVGSLPEGLMEWGGLCIFSFGTISLLWQLTFLWHGFLFSVAFLLCACLVSANKPV